MAKTTYRRHRLFDIVQERRTHGKKRFRYGFAPQFNWYIDLENDFQTEDIHWINTNQTGTAELMQACQRSGYDLQRMVQPGFRFRNRMEAEQFYTLMVLSIGD